MTRAVLISAALLLWGLLATALLGFLVVPLVLHIAGLLS